MPADALPLQCRHTAGPRAASPANTASKARFSRWPPQDGAGYGLLAPLIDRDAFRASLRPPGSGRGRRHGDPPGSLLLRLESGDECVRANNFGGGASQPPSARRAATALHPARGSAAFCSVLPVCAVPSRLWCLPSLVQACYTWPPAPTPLSCWTGGWLRRHAFPVRWVSPLHTAPPHAWDESMDHGSQRGLRKASFPKSRLGNGGWPRWHLLELPTATLRKPFPHGLGLSCRLRTPALGERNSCLAGRVWMVFVGRDVHRWVGWCCVVETCMCVCVCAGGGRGGHERARCLLQRNPLALHLQEGAHWDLPCSKKSAWSPGFFWETGNPSGGSDPPCKKQGGIQQQGANKHRLTVSTLCSSFQDPHPSPPCCRGKP